jgi:hypothetical protein
MWPIAEAGLPLLLKTLQLFRCCRRTGQNCLVYHKDGGARCPQILLTEVSAALAMPASTFPPVFFDTGVLGLPFMCWLIRKHGFISVPTGTGRLEVPTDLHRRVLPRSTKTGPTSTTSLRGSSCHLPDGMVMRHGNSKPHCERLRIVSTQYAMPHAGSFSATAANVSPAFSNQKEWSIATALLNCAWTDGSQETGKFTLRSFPGSPAGCSCWATTGATNAAHTPASSTAEIKVRRFMLASLGASRPFGMETPTPSCNSALLVPTVPKSKLRPSPSRLSQHLGAVGK